MMQPDLNAILRAGYAQMERETAKMRLALEAITVPGAVAVRHLSENMQRLERQ